MSYVGPQDSPKDTVRFLLQDTDVTNEFFTDSEIEYLIETWYPVRSSFAYVAAVGAEMLSARFASEVSVSADGVSVSVSELQNKYQLLAERLRSQAKEEQAAGAEPITGGILWGEFPDPMVKPLTFGVGFMDNYEVGRADYGDYHPGEDGSYHPESSW